MHARRLEGVLNRSFSRLDEGWYAGTPSQEAIDWAVAMQNELDAVKSNDFENFSDLRWQGFLAERAFATWLEEREVAFTWNGGADSKPDFVVLGAGVGCKARSFTSAWGSNFVVNVFERHRGHTDENELFFAAVQRSSDTGSVSSPRVLLLGGIQRDDYFKRAIEVKAGEQLGPHKVAQIHTWNLECGDLETPDVWLARLRAERG